MIALIDNQQQGRPHTLLENEFFTDGDVAPDFDVSVCQKLKHADAATPTERPRYAHMIRRGEHLPARHAFLTGAACSPGAREIAI
jgi:hypothetical protein